MAFLRRARCIQRSAFRETVGEREAVRRQDGRVTPARRFLQIRLGNCALALKLVRRSSPAVAIIDHEDRTVVLLELPCASQFVRGAASIALQQDNIAKSRQRDRIRHRRAARGADRQTELRLLELLPHRPNQLFDVPRDKEPVIPAPFRLIPGIRDIEDDIPRVPLDQMAGNQARGPDDRLRRLQRFVLILLEKHQADDQAALVGRFEQAVQPGQPRGLQGAVRTIGADKRARFLAQIRAGPARNAIHFAGIPRIAALETDDYASHSVTLVEIELRDQAIRIRVRIELAFLQPLVIEEGLGQAQQRQAAPHLAAEAPAIVRARPSGTRAGSLVEPVLLVAGPQHRARRDLESSRGRAEACNQPSGGQAAKKGMDTHARSRTKRRNP